MKGKKKIINSVYDIHSCTVTDGTSRERYFRNYINSEGV